MNASVVNTRAGATVLVKCGDIINGIRLLLGIYFMSFYFRKISVLRALSSRENVS